MSIEDRGIVLYGSELDALELALTGLLGEREYSLSRTIAPGGWKPRLSVPGPPPTVGDSIELQDPDGTPLARLEVSGTEAAGDHTWVSGPVRQLRALEHGPSHHRLSTDTDLRGRVIALFDGQVRAAEVLSALRSPAGASVDLVYCGPGASVTTTRSLDDLAACSAESPGSRVWFLPEAPASGGDDVARRVLRGRGAAEVSDFRKHNREAPGGAVLVFTGLSGSGKSTLARRLVEHLRTDSMRTPVLLDGDDVRRQLSAELGFSAPDRDRNLQRVAWVAARVADAGGIAVCAPIAPFESSRAEMRRKVEPESVFFLIHVATPLAVAEARDRKGLYAKARAGLVKDFTGIDSPYEIPMDADVTVDTSTMTIAECLHAVVVALGDRGVLAPRARRA